MSADHKIRIYFLASGRIGKPLFNTLRNDTRLELVGIGSQPDKPKGRKHQLEPTPVAALAQSLGYSVDKPEKVSSPEFIEHLAALGVEMLVVASYGQLLRPVLLDFPKYGCLNIHASLLPKYRGASPIAQAILDGEQTTGVTFMKMDPGLDTGPMYKKVVCSIEPEENVQELEDKMGMLAAEYVGKVICDIVSGELQPVPQPEDGCSYAKKIKKTDGAIDWQRPAAVIARQICAYTPWPSSFAFFPSSKGPKRFQITSAQWEECPAGVEPGTILQADKTLIVACGDGALKIKKLVPEGKNEMDTAAFLRGTRLDVGTILPTISEKLLP